MMAAYHTVTSQIFTGVGNPGCNGYLVVIYDDNGSDDVHDWEPVAKKVVTEGCEQIDDFDEDDFTHTNHYAVITSSSTDGNGCDVLHLQFYNGDHQETLSGFVNLCNSGVNGKRAMQEVKPLRTGVDIYPTYVADLLRVRNSTGKKGVIRIANPSGAVIQEVQVPFSSSAMNIAVDKLPSGTYFVSFLGPHAIKKQTTIIKK